MAKIMRISPNSTFYRLSYFNLLSLFLPFLCVLAVAACSTTPEFRMPSEIPSSIKAYKSLRVYGNNRKKNTGIVLAEQELFTVIATGNVDRGWQGPFSKISPYEGGFIMHIGDQLYGNIHYGGNSGPTLRAQQAGKLYLGISDGYYKDNQRPL